MRSVRDEESNLRGVILRRMSLKKEMTENEGDEFESCVAKMIMYVI